MKCNDYFIIKIRYYPGRKKLPDSSLNWTGYRKLAEIYVEFRLRMIEHFLGKSRDVWYNTYMKDTIDVACIFLRRETGIIFRSGEGIATIFVPRDNHSARDWIMENATGLKPNIVTRTNTYDSGDMQWKIDDSVEFTAKMKTKFPQLNNGL